MTADERRRAIARYIAEHGEADVQTLAERFRVSSMTIRRDRLVLAGENKIAVTRGGAAFVGYRYGEPARNNKVAANLDKKRAIARVAASLVPDDACVLLDAGTTMLELAKFLFHKQLVVVTVDVHIALLLSQSPTVRVFTPGGEVDRDSQAHTAISAVRYLSRVNASFAFVCSAVWDAAK
ncbi:MAG: DeoR/GlpR family DNA-binding transcription regulator, partial [Methylobacteriaceae bacterium]|nr:DeoR/GlpR family DNA-binding transcription regulator [Methylobacteriaceae bacterium]